MGETLTPDQYLARAAEGELRSARSQIKEMHAQVERLKKMAEGIINHCNWLLTGEDDGKEW